MIWLRLKYLIFYFIIGYGSFLYAGHWQTQLQCSFLFSDNIFESIDHTRSDGGTRLQWQVQSPVIQYKKAWLHGKYRGGFEGYGNYREENRLIHHLTAESGWQFSKHIRLVWDGMVKQRYFLNQSQQYTILQQQAGFRINPGMGLVLDLKFKHTKLGVNDHSVFDYTGQGLYCALKWQASRNWALKVTSEFFALNYEREAYGQLDTLSFLAKGAFQKDQCTRLGFQLELYYDMLIRIGYLYELNTSNSFGFDYNKPQFHFLAARSLTKGWTATLFLKLSWKNYEEKFAPYWPVSPDSEIEENNLIWTSLSKDISPSVLWKTRWGWYRNESPFRDRYYSKHFILTGFSFRF